MSLRSPLAAVAPLALVVALTFSNSRAADDHPVPEPLKQRPPTAFECRWADSPITIDGTADEPAWKHAQEISAFHLPWLGAKARMARTNTTARLLWDREFLYFHARMQDSDIVADIREHDGDLWKNDVFELFLRPDAEKTGYYEFQVSPNGTQFDAFYPKYDLEGIAKQSKLGAFHMEAKAKVVGAKGEQVWVVEGRIPWVDFLRTGGRPVAGETWKLNLARFDYHKDWKEPELSCVAPIAKKKLAAFFHQTDDYASLKFVGVDATTVAKPYALERREPLTTSTVVGFPDPPPPYVAVPALEKYRPEFPICARAIPGTGEWIVITQPRAYAHSAVFRFKYAGATAEGAKVLDTPGEGTAYDIAFHPKWAENGYVYFGWNGKLPGQKDKHSVVTRYTMSTKAPYALDPASAKTIIDWPSDGHNGAAVCFGKDGLMYVTSGDGTSDSDTNLMGQRTDSLLAKVLRIDVDTPADGKAYSVPKDNPFVGNKDFVPETWAMGLRAPWRITYDAKGDQLWVCQNGQDLWEQAFLVKKGANYGWSVMEGSHEFYANRKAGPKPFALPTVEHHHREARSLTGGVVYRGKARPELDGAYVYGDYSTGHIWAVKHTGAKVEWHKKIAITTLKITGFEVDPDGELIVLHHAPSGEGGFFKLVPNTAKHEDTFPKKLSQSGLFESVAEHTMKPGVLPYSVNAPFWSDGAYKVRFVAVPEGTVGYNRARSFDFPDKTVLVKSFALEMKPGDPTSRKWIETRFMTRQGGEWYGYSYMWNPEGTDATLVGAEGTNVSYALRGGAAGAEAQWRFPSRAECMVCHSRASNFVLGLCEAQLNRDHTYPNGRTDNQLRTFERIGLLNGNWGADLPKYEDAAYRQQPNQRAAKSGPLLPVSLGSMKKLADPYDKAQPLDARARAWLHTNCASCHVEAGGGNAQFNLAPDTAWDKTKLIGVKPLHNAFNIPDALLVAPGAPDKSVLIRRIGARGANSGQMPPIASFVPDRAGVELMTEWCKGLKK